MSAGSIASQPSAPAGVLTSYGFPNAAPPAAMTPPPSGRPQTRLTRPEPGRISGPWNDAPNRAPTGRCPMVTVARSFGKTFVPDAGTIVLLSGTDGSMWLERKGRGPASRLPDHPY